MASNVPPAPATEEAIGLVRHCKTVLEEHAYQIRAESNITDALNGPQGHVSAKTVNSVQLMEWGLGRLADILGEYDYKALDLLSCMTLDVENCHATVHSKKVNVSKLEYARSFGATMKESVKRATSWAAYYHTSRRSWYPKPDTTVSLHNVPLMMPLSVVSLPANDCDLLRNWASAYGAAVRQRTVRQETTMAKHGTLPEYLYQRHLEVGDKVNLNFGVDEDEGPHEDLNEREVSEEASVSSEGQQEFDESSDEEVEVSADDNNSQGQQDELGASTNFLFGARSRYGRAVRFNNRLLF